jgi:uncharacterized membrane protein (DUF2068 family)
MKGLVIDHPKARSEPARHPPIGAPLSGRPDVAAASSTSGSVSRSSTSRGGEERDQGAQHDRLLPWIAAERSIRAVILVLIGVVLITHPNTDWGRSIGDLATHLGFDPSRNGIQKIMAQASAITPHKAAIFGVIAIAYGGLEGAEGYGLWRRRRWGEYLTVAATSTLFIPEIWELTKKASALKAAALVANVAIVVYLIVRLRRKGG